MYACVHAKIKRFIIYTNKIYMHIGYFYRVYCIYIYMYYPFTQYTKIKQILQLLLFADDLMFVAEEDENVEEYLTK